MPARFIEYLPLSAVLRAPKNPKRHSMDVLEASMARHGFVESPTIDERTGRLVAGHGRIDRLELDRAAGKEPPDGVEVDGEGEWLVPVARGWSSRDDDDAAAYLLTSNQATIGPGWELPELAPMLEELFDTPLGLEGTGFDREALDEMLAGLVASPNPWTDRPLRGLPDAGGFTAGQVWDVGPHRLVVGDARDAEVWALLPPADLIVTDPPYGIDYGGGLLERERLEGDLDVNEAAALLGSVLSCAVEVAQPGAAVYTFLPGGEAFPVLVSVLAGLGLHRWSIVWVKDSATFGRADFHAQHEHISYGWLPGPRLVPVEDRTLTTVWEHPRPRASLHHPTEKPVGLLTKAIEASSRHGMVVCDPFAGSGSTLVAAAQAGRVGCGIELRPEYGRVAVHRLVEVTGEQAVLASAPAG